MAKAFVITVPFASTTRAPIDLLEKSGIECIVNPYGKDIAEEQFADMVKDVDYIVAGLPKFTSKILDNAKKLKLIARVGVGLDNIPFEETKKRGIKVTYTPTAVTEAVSELTVGLILDCLRRFTMVNQDMHSGKWNKYLGRLLEGKTVGIIGAGRIGKRVASLLKSFNTRILACDPVKYTKESLEIGYEYVELDELLSLSDVITVHISCNQSNRHAINNNSIDKMKDGVIIINTSRGSAVNEEDLYQALVSGKVAYAAIDVFEEEPYCGKLKELSNILLTSHIGAGTIESREQMELGAVEEVVRFHQGKKLLFEVDHN